MNANGVAIWRRAYADPPLRRVLANAIVKACPHVGHVPMSGTHVGNVGETVGVRPLSTGLVGRMEVLF